MRKRPKVPQPVRHTDGLEFQFYDNIILNFRVMLVHWGFRI